MKKPNDDEIRKIVDEVVSRLMATNPNPSSSQPQPSTSPDSAGGKQIAIGADHGGYPMKETLKDLILLFVGNAFTTIADKDICHL